MIPNSAAMSFVDRANGPIEGGAEGDQAVARHAPCRLQSEDAAERGRLADRSAGFDPRASGTILVATATADPPLERRGSACVPRASRRAERRMFR
jgi:hypothetical protein